MSRPGDDLAASEARLVAAEKAAQNAAVANAAALGIQAEAARAAAQSNAMTGRLALAAGVGVDALTNALLAEADKADAAALKTRSIAETATAAGVSIATMTAALAGAAKAEADAAAASAPVALGFTKMLTLGKLFSGGFWSLATWHYLVDGAVELGIVLGGAALALTAFGLAGAKAADAILTHFQALTTVASATGHAIAPLNSAMASLQRSMAPDVVQLYGDALQVVNAKQGAFATLARQSGSVLDYWGARASIALQRSPVCT